MYPDWNLDLTGGDTIVEALPEVFVLSQDLPGRFARGMDCRSNEIGCADQGDGDALSDSFAFLVVERGASFCMFWQVLDNSYT